MILSFPLLKRNAIFPAVKVLLMLLMNFLSKDFGGVSYFDFNTMHEFGIDVVVVRAGTFLLESSDLFLKKTDSCFGYLGSETMPYLERVLYLKVKNQLEITNIMSLSYIYIYIYIAYIYIDR